MRPQVWQYLVSGWVRYSGGGTAWDFEGRDHESIQDIFEKNRDFGVDLTKFLAVC